MQTVLAPLPNDVVRITGDVTLVVDAQDTSFAVVVAHMPGPAKEADRAIRPQSHDIFYLSIRGGNAVSVGDSFQGSIAHKAVSDRLAFEQDKDLRSIAGCYMDPFCGYSGRPFRPYS